MARRSAATACFSACRSFRDRVSVASAKCVILGRCAPTLRSLDFAYGSIAEFSGFCLRYIAQAGLRFEAALRTRPRRGSICRRVIPLPRCQETMQFHSQYQINQKPCCASPLELRRLALPGAMSLVRSFRFPRISFPPAQEASRLEKQTAQMPRKSKTRAKQHWRRTCRISGQITLQSAHWCPSRRHRKLGSDLARSCALFENEIRSAQNPPCLLLSRRHRRDKPNTAVPDARLRQSAPLEVLVRGGEGEGVGPPPER